LNRGDIWHCDLSPSAGREQKGNHYVLIISPAAFDRGGVPMVCPITTIGSSARMRGFAVNLQGSGTAVTGVIQCDQIRALDMNAHKGRNANDQVPAYIMQDVLSRIALIAQ
jgi:mRNA interferase ChpB